MPTSFHRGYGEIAIADSLLMERHLWWWIKEINLIEVGPAHTKGDSIVYIPGGKVLLPEMWLWAQRRR